MGLFDAAAWKLADLETRVLALEEMMLTPFQPSFDPTDGTWIDVTAAPYSATGDGETDDLAAINSAISAARTAGKGVYFPAGTYNIGTSSYLGLASGDI